MRALPMMILLVVLAVAPASAQIATYTTSWSVPDHPYGILLHPNGEIWVGHQQGVDRYTSDGTHIDPTSLADYPCYGLALASNNDVFSSDYSGARIVRFTSAGTFVSEWDTGTFASLYLATDGTDVYATQYVGSEITGKLLRYSEAGVLLDTLTIDPAPIGIAYDNGSLRVAKQTTGDILTVDPATLTITGGFAATVGFYEQVAVDAQGRIYVADYQNQTVYVFENDGTPYGTIGPMVEGYGSIQPEGVAIAADGTIYVGDDLAKKILVLSPISPVTPSTWGGIKQLFR